MLVFKRTLLAEEKLNRKKIFGIIYVFILS